MVARGNNGWTLDTLEKYLSSRIESIKDNTSIAMAAADKAVSKAETAAEKRFDSVNEFRNAMKDQQTTFADKAQTDFRLGVIEKTLEKASGVSLGVSIAAAAAAGLIAAIASVVTIEAILRH
jgi:hypothetical protein